MGVEITVVLVRPSRAMNVGSIARVMANFGLNKLILVDPKVNLNDKDAHRTARHAYPILESTLVIPSLEKLHNEVNYLIGTTARLGGKHNVPRTTQQPEALCKLELAPKTAVIFGPEDSGLSNEEIGLCNLLITIPTSEEYKAMNLSHAASIILYELLKNPEIKTIETEAIFQREATDRERSILMEQAEIWLDLISYHKERRHVAQQVLKNAFLRNYLSGREVSTLIGLIRYTNSSLVGKNPIWKRLEKQLPPIDETLENEL